MSQSLNVRSRRSVSRRGVTLIYISVILALLIGVVSLAVDWGRVQVAKGELQTAADAAARAAAAVFPQGQTTSRDAAVLWASLNKADGSGVTLVDTASNNPATDDVVFGQWDPITRTFNAASAVPNAIRITARRTSARGTAVPLLFAQNRPSFDVSAAATAVGLTANYAIVGLTGVTMIGSATLDSWNSSSGAYTTGTANDNGSVASNGNITLTGAAKINGDANAGGSVSGNVTGDTTDLGMTLTYPPVTAPDMSYSTTPAGYVSANNFSVGSTTSVNFQAGTYYYNNFTVGANAEIRGINGPVVIYVAGTLTISGEAYAYQDRPGNMIFRVINNGAVSVGGNGQIYADIYAPLSAVSVGGTGDFYGRLVGKSVAVSGNGGIHFDETLAPYGAAAQLVQ